jgi:hypothetical protein
MARGSNLTEVKLAGSPSGAAVLIGTLDMFPDPSATKVFRRDKSRVWYCPHVKKGLGDASAAVNAEGLILVAVLGDSSHATLLRFEPK